MSSSTISPAETPVSPRRAAVAPERTQPSPAAGAAIAAPFDPSRADTMPLTRVLHYWFDEIWCKGNMDAVAETMTPHTLISGAVSALAEPECDYTEIVTVLRNLMGPMSVVFTHAIETDDWVSARLLVSTSDPGNGTPFQITGQVMARIERGKITELHSNMDYFRMFEELGQLPPESLAICMSGERLK